MSKQLMSVVIPSYNEEKNVPLIYDKLKQAIDSKRFSYEIIFVNDGSKDKTWQAIDTLAKKDSHVIGINFSRNSGHAAALEAGLMAARGDVIVMMDADLQHPPEIIKKLVEKYDEGNDIVNTVRLTTSDAGALKKLSSSMFYRFINAISDLRIHDGEADYRLLSRRALDTLNALPETPKFYRGLVNWIGYDVARVEYEAGSRIHGKSSYTLKKMLELARMGVTSFSLKPLKLIFSIGVGLTGMAFILLLGMVIIKAFIDPELISYNAILTDVLLLVTGILTIFQGIIAIYMIDIFNTTKGRPTYIIKERTDDRDHR